MAGSLNRVMLIGRCTADPEMRYLPSGLPVTQLRIATNRYGSSQDGERREFTDYHDVQTRSWDGQDGQKRYRTEVNANDIQFLEPRGAEGAEGAPRVAPFPPLSGQDEPSQGPADGPEGDIDPDDIPF